MSQTDLITVETDMTEDCRAILVKLQSTYTKIIGGNTRAKVRFQNRWTEYHPGNARALLALIQGLRAQCDDVAGLPDFNPAKRAKRGRPAFLRVD